MLRVFHIDVYALLNPKGIFSFVTSYIEVDFGISPEILSEPFSVFAPIGDSVRENGNFYNLNHGWT